CSTRGKGLMESTRASTDGRLFDWALDASREFFIHSGVAGKHFSLVAADQAEIEDQKQVAKSHGRRYRSGPVQRSFPAVQASVINLRKINLRIWLSLRFPPLHTLLQFACLLKFLR